MSRPLLPLNGFRAFEAAARHLSFAKAAEELRVTPAAVSHQVRTLEAYLGLRLFRRAARRVLLTEAGQMLLPDLRDGFERLEAAMARARRLGGAGSGVLTITMSPAFAAKWLVPRLERFRERHPDIDVRIDADARLVDLAAEEVDLGIRYGPGEYPGLETTRLFAAEEVFPVCSPRLLEGPCPLRTPADLAGHTLLHDETATLAGSLPTWRMWLQAAGVDIAGIGIDSERGLRFSASAMATQAAIEGQGVLLGRSVIVADDLAAGRLVRPFVASCPLRFGYHLVHPRHVATKRTVAVFKEWILQEAGARR